jgi:hypothetical protein
MVLSRIPLLQISHENAPGPFFVWPSDQSECLFEHSFVLAPLALPTKDFVSIWHLGTPGFTSPRFFAYRLTPGVTR